MAAGDSTQGVESAARENRSLLAVLRRRAWIIIAVTVLAGAAAFGIGYAYRDSYESTAKILFQQTISPEMNAIGLLPTSLDADNLAQNNVEVAGSRTVAAATAQELRARGSDKSVDDIVNDVRVSDTTQSDVVNIVASASSGRGASELATVYANQAVRFVQNEQRAGALQALRNLQQQLRGLSPDERQSAQGRRLRADAEQIRTIANVGPGNPRVIQEGFIPDTRSGNLLQTTLLGVLFGLVLGIGLALLREQADRRLRQAEDISAAFDAPVLTTVPRSRQLRRNVPFEDLPPQVAEAFRMLQINLRYGSGGSVRTVLVTSARNGEGKTTVAWNLARAAAAAGVSIALVEADFRRPVLAKRYGLQPEPGLAEAIRAETYVEKTLQPIAPSPSKAATNGHQDRLDVMVAGKPPSDPWALMQSTSMPRVLEIVAGDHDLVIIDAPPIPYVADAISMLEKVDGVIVTASVNSIQGPEAERLRDQLQALDARVLGVVANNGSAARGYAYAPARQSSDISNGGAAASEQARPAATNS